MVAALLLPRGARAGIATSELCSGDPCVITRDHNLDTGSALALDFGEADVIVEATLTLDATDVTFIARSFEIRQRGQIRGDGDVVIQVAGDVRLDGKRSNGTVRLFGDGTTLSIDSLGSVFANGSIRLVANDADSDGGTISIAAATDVELRGEMEGIAGNFGEGGSLEIEAGRRVVVSGALDLNGGEFGGGSVLVTAGGSVIFDSAVLDGNGELSDGGAFEINAGGDVFLFQRIRNRGSGTSAEDCGDGGDVDIASHGLLQIGGAVDVRARIGDCCGGSINLSAAQIILNSPLSAMSDGGDGCGGDVSIDVSESLECANTASIDVHGADPSGDLSIVSGGDVSAQAGCTVDASGPDGSIEVRSTGDIAIEGNWRAGGSSVAAIATGTAGTGAAIPLVELSACRVTIGSNASIATTGSNTANRITALGGITILGDLRAGLANILTFPPGVTPLISGIVEPDASEVADSALVPCIALPTTTPTTAPTTTATPVATATATMHPPATPTSPRPTATARPNDCRLPCPADCNGDCQVSIGELIRAVQISLGETEISQCAAADRDRNGTVSIADLISAVGSALRGCSL